MHGYNPPPGLTKNGLGLDGGAASGSRVIVVGDGTGSLFTVSVDGTVFLGGVNAGADTNLTIQQPASPGNDAIDVLDGNDNFVFYVASDGSIGPAGPIYGKSGLALWGGTPPGSQPVLATGAGHTVDNVITLLQSYSICKQS